jgi:hypothetical protein
MYIDELMTFLHKSKFLMIKIAIIITITIKIVSCYGQTFLFLEKFIISAKECRYWSIVIYPVWFPILDILQPYTLYFHKETVTPENIEGRLIISQQSQTQFFKSKCNKRKLEGHNCNRSQHLSIMMTISLSHQLINSSFIILLRRWSYVLCFGNLMLSNWLIPPISW